MWQGYIIVIYGFELNWPSKLCHVLQVRGKLLSAAGNVGSTGAQLLEYMGEPEVDQQTQVEALVMLSGLLY